MEWAGDELTIGGGKIIWGNDEAERQADMPDI
jgi:hypothetical protein